MKAGPHPILAQGKVRYVGDHVACVVADDLPAGQGRRRAGRGRLRGPAGLRRDRACARPGPAPGPRRDPAQHGLRLGAGRQGARSTQAIAKAAHVTKIDLVNNRLVPNAIEPRAAIGQYDQRPDELHALHHQPEPARRAAGDRGVRRRGARAQAARGRARRRRRLRLEDLHLRRGVRLPAGGQEGRPAGQVDRRAQRELPLRRARPRPRHPRRSSRSMPTATSPRSRCTPSRTWAPICRPSPPACRPTSTPRCWPASTRRRRSTARSMPSTPTPRRWTPIAAPAGPRRPTCSRPSSRPRRARPGATRPSCGARTSSPRTPSPTRRRSR